MKISEDTRGRADHPAETKPIKGLLTAQAGCRRSYVAPKVERARLAGAINGARGGSPDGVGTKTFN